MCCAWAANGAWSLLLILERCRLLSWIWCNRLRADQTSESVYTGPSVHLFALRNMCLLCFHLYTAFSRDKGVAACIC